MFILISLSNSLSKNTLQNIKNIVMVRFCTKIFVEFSLEMQKFLPPVQPNLDVLDSAAKKHRKLSYSSIVYFKRNFCNVVYRELSDQKGFLFYFLAFSVKRL